MAKFNVVGLDDVQEAMLRQDAIVEEAVPEMLKAGGAVMQKAQQEEIKTRFNSRRSTGALLASIKVSAVKEIDGGKRVEIYPNGKDKHGVRNAEKGFVLNYGRSNNGLQNVLDDNAATNLLNITNALDARVDMLEAVLFNDITTNPFLILFDDLDGVTSTGIWNESLQRIEC